MNVQYYFAFSPIFDEDVTKVWNFEHSVEQYQARGGTSKSSVLWQIESVQKQLQQLKFWRNCAMRFSSQNGTVSVLFFLCAINNIDYWFNHCICNFNARKCNSVSLSKNANRSVTSDKPRGLWLCGHFSWERRSPQIIPMLNHSTRFKYL